jgi:hypothetical protein
MRAALVVGSQIDPANIANPHIARMPLEGRYFGRRWRKLCRTMRFALKFSSKRTLTPAWLRG